MATSSEVKAGLDNIAETIRAARLQMVGAKGTASSVSANLNGLPTTFADVLSTINGYANDTTDAFEKLSKAELAKLTTEFVALLAAADSVAATNLG